MKLLLTTDHSVDSHKAHTQVDIRTISFDTLTAIRNT